MESVPKLSDDRLSEVMVRYGSAAVHEFLTMDFFPVDTEFVVGHLRDIGLSEREIPKALDLSGAVDLGGDRLIMPRPTKVPDLMFYPVDGEPFRISGGG